MLLKINIIKPFNAMFIFICLIKNKVFASLGRYITSYQLVNILSISNEIYTIISIIIFILFLIQNTLYLIKIIKYNENDLREKIETYKFPIIFDNLLFLFYPF